MQSFEQEPPLTQRDIDSFLKMWPEMLASQEEEISEEQVEALYARHGFSKVRGAWATMKIVNGLMMVQVGPENRSAAMQAMEAMQMPQSLIPTEPESALVEQNLDKLQALAETMQ